MYTTPEEIMDALYTLLDDNKVDLGLKFIGYGEEKVTFAYPAVWISGGPIQRVIHATHTFQAELGFVLWVYHAKLTIDHKTRTQEDLALATGIRTLLHSNMTLGLTAGKPNIVNGYVDSETPGQINRSKGDAVVGTRMTYVATVQERF